MRNFYCGELLIQSLLDAITEKIAADWDAFEMVGEDIHGIEFHGVNAPIDIHAKHWSMTIAPNWSSIEGQHDDYGPFWIDVPQTMAKALVYLSFDLVYGDGAGYSYAAMHAWENIHGGIPKDYDSVIASTRLGFVL